MLTSTIEHENKVEKVAVIMVTSEVEDAMLMDEARVRLIAREWCS